MTKHVSPETALFILDRAIDRELSRRRGQQGLAEYVRMVADRQQADGFRPKLKVV